MIAAGITVGVVGLLLLATFTWLRSTPHTHAVLLDVLLAAAPGCWAIANGGATLYNEKLDQGAPQSLPVQVLYTEKTRGRRSTHYYLHVERWPDPRGDRSVRIDKAEYDWMERSSCITVKWHAGRVGDGWVSGYQRGCPNNEAEVEK